MTFTIVGYGQGYLSFYQLRDYVPQTQGLNPAHSPTSGFVFSIPALNSSVNVNTGFPTSDLLVKQDDGALVIDFDNLSSVVNEENTFGLDFTSNLFHIQFNAFGGSVSLFSNARANLNLNYDDDLINLLANGNGNSIGETISLNEEINLMSYNEYGIGYATSLLQGKLKIGVRAKYLNGQFYGGSEDDGQLDIYTDPENYSITISAQNLGIQTSGTDLLLNPDDYEDGLGNYIVWTDNTGYSLDFGATFALTDKLTLEGSVTDIGSITWQDYVINYDILDNSMTIDGAELASGDEDEEGGFDAIADELETFFDANENYESFTTSLNMKTYLGATYKLAPSHRFGVTVYNNSVFGNFDPSYAVAYNWLPGGRTTIGTLMSFGGMIPEPQLGLNLATNLGPIQFYAATNDFLGLTKPEDMQGVNVRFGFNIIIGRNSYTKRTSISNTSWD